MRTFKDIIEPLKDKLIEGPGKYTLVVRTDDKMMYALPEDKELGDTMTSILNEISSMESGIELLFGKRVDSGIPLTTYLDRDGSVVDIFRDKSNKSVTLCWTLPKTH